MSRYIDADILGSLVDNHGNIHYEHIKSIPSMTLKELKEEAKKKGYKLVKDIPYLKLKPCICGGKHRTQWFGVKGYRFTCDKCGLTSEWGKSERKAKELWNEMIIRLTKEKEVSNDN